MLGPRLEDAPACEIETSPPLEHIIRHTVMVGTVGDPHRTAPDDCHGVPPRCAFVDANAKQTGMGGHDIGQIIFAVPLAHMLIDGDIDFSRRSKACFARAGERRSGMALLADGDGSTLPVSRAAKLAVRMRR